MIYVYGHNVTIDDDLYIPMANMLSSDSKCLRTGSDLRLNLSIHHTIFR